jgi:superfamily II DNA or RNA helicase
MINEEKRKIQEEAITSLAEANYRGIVILPTGTGKSLVLIECLKRLYQPGMRVLYTCDSQDLRDKGFDEELVKWDAREYCDKIEKCCYKSAYKKKYEEYDILLADEGDYALTPKYSELFFNNKFKYIIFVSATLDKKKRPLADILLPIVYQKEVKEIEDRKVINKANFIFVPYLLTPKEDAKYKRYNERFSEILNAQPNPFLDAKALKEWQDKKQRDIEFLTFQRLHFLESLESSVHICRRLFKHIYEESPESRVVAFCGQTDQADKICRYSYHEKNADVNNLQRFDNGEINYLSVCGKIDRGKNLIGVNKIVLENYNRSETKLVQRTGRGRRLKVDEMLDVYILLPFYTNNGKPKPTIMLDWIMEAGKKLGIENAKTLYLKIGG